MWYEVFDKKNEIATMINSNEGFLVQKYEIFDSPI